MIKPGTTAILKTSEEPVFVIEVTPTSSEKVVGHVVDALSGTTVLVRRPIATESGVQHVVERYLLEEIETPEEKTIRHKKELEGLRKQFTADNLEPEKESFLN